MKIWIDDILPAPDESYRRCHSVLQAKKFVEAAERAQTLPVDMWRNPDDINKWNIEKISIRYSISLDYMDFLEWLEQTDRNHYPVELH